MLSFKNLTSKALIMQQPQFIPSSLSSYGVQYLGQRALEALMATAPQSVLGVIGFGADRPTYLGECPFARAAIEVIDGGAIFETWTVQGSARTINLGGVTGSATDEIAFGLITAPEHNARLETSIHLAYREIFDFIDDWGNGKSGIPIRFWNYLPRISDD